MSTHEKNVNWINMAQDKKYQRGVVKTVLTFRFRKIGGVNFVICRGTSREKVCFVSSASLVNWSVRQCI